MNRGFGGGVAGELVVAAAGSVEVDAGGVRLKSDKEEEQDEDGERTTESEKRDRKCVEGVENFI